VLHTKADPPIIHQDVSSDNILLNVIDGALVTKVVDFGTARYAPALLEEGRTHHTTGIVISKKLYQPYEYTNRDHISEKTGTFAFGVVLCELLTGEPPKDRESGEMLVAKMLEPLADSEHALPRMLDKRLSAGEARSVTAGSRRQARVRCGALHRGGAGGALHRGRRATRARHHHRRSAARGAARSTTR
jgi:serine/threonine protein kinase